MMLRARDGLLVTVALAVLAGCATEDESEPGVEPEPICIDAPAEARSFSLGADETFLAGPYLMHTTAESAVVMWQTATPCAGELRYGAAPDELTETVSLPDEDVIHEATVSGLVAGGHTYYQVSSCGQSSAVLDFFAAPEVGAAVRFTVMGDSQSNPEQGRATLMAMAQHEPFFVLHAGDTVGNGLVDGIFVDELLEPLRPLGHHVPLYAAIGNHEANSPAWYDLVSYPDSVPDEPGHESFYSFSFGNVFVLVIDTNKLFWDIDTGGEVLELPYSAWIKAQLSSKAARSATWRVAIGHEPAINESWSPGGCGDFVGNEHVRDWLLPRMAEARFHAYFSGHTHAYERGALDGVLHLVTGGGGGHLDEWCEDLPEVEVAESVHHYLVVDAACDALTMTAYRTEDDSVIDRVTLDPARWGEIVAPR